jgi:hypothetical protein
MINSPLNDNVPPPEGDELQDRRLFLRGMGKWSGAAIAAAVAGTWLGTQQQASGWINRRGGGGGWINGGGGGWVNRRGGGGWINR